MDEVKKATPRASEQDWKWAEEGESFSGIRCILDLRDRVAALEAAADTSAPAAAPAGVSVDELADCLPANAWAGPEGYSRQAFARHLLDHPRIGALLRGEGAAAPKRVVLAEEPPTCLLPGGRRALDLAKLVRLVWAAARTEVERQQQGGQAIHTPAPVRVVLPEEPPEADTPRCWRRIDGPYKLAWQDGFDDAWAAARTEVERQQQGGQADG